MTIFQLMTFHTKLHWAQNCCVHIMLDKIDGFIMVGSGDFRHLVFI